MADQACKHANEKYEKYHKKGHISRFYDSYIFLNKKKTPGRPITSSLDSKKKVSGVTQVVANKIFDTGIIQKIIGDSGTTQYHIANCELIHDYYDNYFEYQTRSGKVLPFYGKGILLMPLDNSFLKVSNVWYTPNLGFNLISIIQLGEKGVEMGLQIMNQPSQILYDRAILGYADFIDGQYVFRLKQSLKTPTIANLADIQSKKDAKLGDIELWHLRMGHLSYKNLIMLKNLNSRMDVNKTTLSKLCGDCQKRDQTCQPSRSLMS